MKCYYHSQDCDGHASGAIVKHYEPEAELIPMNHGWPFDWTKIVPGETLYFVDFSLPVDDMAKLHSMCDVRVIDHHISKIKEFEARGLKFKGLLDTKFAGCELTWLYFNPGKPIPYWVTLLGRYDVWDHKDPNVLSFQYGMRTKDTDPITNPDIWERFFNHGGCAEMITTGQTILAFVDQENAVYAKTYAFETELDGYKAIAINRGVTGSKIFDSLPHYDLKITFCRGNDSTWKVSLYSSTIDVSVLAKKYGGGGHAGAAGFQCTELPFKY